MKKITFYATMFLMVMISVLSFLPDLKAQESGTTKVYAVINRAGWCPVCKANGPRVINEVIPVFKNMPVKFISNDLTNKVTTAASAKQLSAVNILSAVKDINYTGIIILVDAKTKKVIKTIDTDEPTDKIIGAIKFAEN